MPSKEGAINFRIKIFHEYVASEEFFSFLHLKSLITRTRTPFESLCIDHKFRQGTEQTRTFDFDPTIGNEHINTANK